MALYASTSLGGVALKAEHLTAVKSFQAGDLEETITSAAKPSATHIEADLDLKKEHDVDHIIYIQLTYLMMSLYCILLHCQN